MRFDVHKVVDDAETGKALVGSKGYFGDTLVELENNVANEDGKYELCIVCEGRPRPFGFQLHNGWTHCSYYARYYYPVEEKKEEPKYRPFFSVDELVSTFENRVCKNPNARPPFTMPLIWVRYKVPATEIGTIQLITAFSKDGVEMGAEFMNWEYFFEKMEFLDGTPCGVKIN